MIRGGLGRPGRSHRSAYIGKTFDFGRYPGSFPGRFGERAYKREWTHIPIPRYYLGIPLRACQRWWHICDMCVSRLSCSWASFCFKKGKNVFRSISRYLYPGISRDT